MTFVRIVVGKIASHTHHVLAAIHFLRGIVAYSHFITAKVQHSKCVARLNALQSSLYLVGRPECISRHKISHYCDIP